MVSSCVFRVVLQVCKYFLEAIENNKYGWFWVCPGGGDNCMYRHALPPGFVLKKDKKKEEKEEEISLEELIENEVRMDFICTTLITVRRFKCDTFFRLSPSCSERLWASTWLASPWRLSWLGRRGKGRRRLETRLFCSLSSQHRVCFHFVRVY